MSRKADKSPEEENQNKVARRQEQFSPKDVGEKGLNGFRRLCNSSVVEVL